MNEILKQLKEQAEFVGDRYALHDEFAEKFAELIINECAEFADDYNSEVEGVTLGVGKAIKQHFGVAE
jgi:hypothetical protein